MPVNPVNLNVATPKKKNIGLRIEETLADKLTEIAKIEDITTTDIITGLITDFLEDKVVYNNYLEDKVNEIINIPYNPTAKEIVIGRAININRNPNYLAGKIKDIIEEFYYYSMDINNKCSVDEFGIYESIFTPNNLDVYDTDKRSYRSIEDIGKLHNGIEILIEPNVAKYYERLEYVDYTGCMYIIYYEKTINGKINIILIDYYTAIKYSKEVGNDYLFNLLTIIYNKLKTAEDVEEIEALAGKYNTGNIINLEDKVLEEVKPLKLVTINNQTVIKQHDKEIIEKLKKISIRNKEVDTELEIIKEELMHYKEELLKSKTTEKEDNV